MNVEWFSSLGVGGVLAGVMFHFYRRDRLTTRAMLIETIKERAEREDRLMGVIERHASATEKIAVAMTDLATIERDESTKLELIAYHTKETHHDMKNLLGRVSRLP